MNGGGSLEPPFLTDIPAQIALVKYKKLIHNVLIQIFCQVLSDPEQLFPP